MRFFRGRKETLNEKLLREAGLSTDEVAPPPPAFSGRPPADIVGIHGVARPRDHDVVVTAEAPGVAGDEVEFVTLPDGSLLVEEEASDARLDALAQAVEEELAPPYRAKGVRKSERLWAVSADAIEVVELPDDVAGDEVTITRYGDERTGKCLPLEGFVAERHPELDAYAATAERLDGSLWEVRVSPL